MYLKDSGNISQPTSWESEELYSSADIFFSSLEKSINEASSSVDLETYIFEDDELGRRIAESLISAASRGVAVRVIVDGVGSQGWIFSIGARLRAHGVQIKVYHQLPWERLFSVGSRKEGDPIWIKLFKVINRRNHRKLCIIDGTTAWVGSMNISDVSLTSVNGQQAWREMGIKVRGEGIKFLHAAFELTWTPALFRFRKLRRQALKLILQSRFSSVRLNASRRLRTTLYRDLLNTIVNAKQRVWIATAYFIPSQDLIRALGQASKNNVDVRIVVAASSDHFFMTWACSVFQNILLGLGVKIFAYRPANFHAKYMIIDDWAMLGSSNLNHRSLFHDLEVDLTTKTPMTLKAMSQEFDSDTGLSTPITSEGEARPAWRHRLLGRIVLFCRYFL